MLTRAAIAAVDVIGDVEHALAALGVVPVAEGRHGLRCVPGVDQAVVARWGPKRATLMPHGSPAAVRLLTQGLLRAGFSDATGEGWWCLPAPAPGDWGAFDDALAAALAAARSPLALDVLLEQRERWASAWEGGDNRAAPLSEETSRALARLIHPPLVAVIGRPNIGKSTLVNALARRDVSVVADQPGTTRDYVGAEVEIGGLVVRLVDAPGIEGSAQPGTADAAAQGAALQLAHSADLVLLCSDAASGPAVWNPAAGRPGATNPGITLRVGLRADLGPPGGEVDVCVSVPPSSPPTGLERLGAMVTEALVPAAARRSSAPWAFWEALAGPRASLPLGDHGNGQASV
jgi:hypothetical protein